MLLDPPAAGQVASAGALPAQPPAGLEDGHLEAAIEGGVAQPPGARHGRRTPGQDGDLDWARCHCFTLRLAEFPGGEDTSAKSGRAGLLTYFPLMLAPHSEMVRRACEAWCDGDISVYREMYTPDVVAEGGSMWPEGDGSETGVERLIANLESIMSAFERSELIPEKFHEHGDALLAEILWRGALPGAETPVEQRVVCAYRFRDGLIAYTAWFSTLAEAAAALGIVLPADEPAS